MKDIIQNMDKAFDSRIRLGIMAILMVNDWVDFNTLKERLGVTDGNLASHTASLEKKKFIKVRKRFVKKRPNTSYQVTPLGKATFSTYLQALKQLLNLKS